MADTMILEIETLINKSLLEQTDKIIGAVGKQAQKTENAISKMGGAFKTVAGMAAAYLSVGQVMKGIDLASDFTENRNKLEAVFAGQVDDADKFINDMAASLNLGKRQLEKEMADVGAIIKGIGFEDTDLKGNTQAVLKAAKDVASFYNVDMESAIRKITTGLTGETEALKLLGINIQETPMEEYAAKLGLTWNKLDSTAKAQLRLNAVLGKLKDSGAAGDAERTKNEYAALERSLTSLTSEITGDFFMSIKDSMIPVMQKSQEFLIKNKDAIVEFGGKIGEFVGQVINGVGVISDFVSENKELVAIGLEVAGVIGGAILAYKTVITLTEVWAAAQTLLNGAMALSPVGLVAAAVVAVGYGLYKAYQHVEPFRNAVNAMFDVLKKGWEWLKESKLGQMFSKLFGGSEKGVKLSEETKSENISKKIDESIATTDGYVAENITNINKNTTENTVKHSFEVDIKADDVELKAAMDTNVKKTIKETIEEHERNRMLNLGLT